MTYGNSFRRWVLRLHMCNTHIVRGEWAKKKILWPPSSLASHFFCCSHIASLGKSNKIVFVNEYEIYMFLGIVSRSLVLQFLSLLEIFKSYQVLLLLLFLALFFSNFAFGPCFFLVFSSFRKPWDFIVVGSMST